MGRFLPPAIPYRTSTGARHYPGAVYADVPGYRTLQMDLWIPETSTTPRVVIWIHGGAWMIGDRRFLPDALRPGQVFDELLAVGMAVATIDYRHAREASFPAQLHDAKAAVRWLRHHAGELGLDTGRIGVWGESAGGHLAALLALTADRPDLEGGIGVVGPSSAVQVAVDWYGVSDLDTVPPVVPPPHIAAALAPEDLVPPTEILLRHSDSAARAAVSPIAHVGTATLPPFFLVHGSDDGVVPFDQSTRLAAALVAAGGEAKLELVPGADHGFDGCSDVDGIVARSVAFLSRALA